MVGSSLDRCGYEHIPTLLPGLSLDQVQLDSLLEVNDLNECCNRSVFREDPCYYLKARMSPCISGEGMIH